MRNQSIVFCMSLNVHLSSQCLPFCFSVRVCPFSIFPMNSSVTIALCAFLQTSHQCEARRKLVDDASWFNETIVNAAWFKLFDDATPRELFGSPQPRRSPDPRSVTSPRMVRPVGRSFCTISWKEKSGRSRVVTTRLPRGVWRSLVFRR